jgi:UDP-N-acetylmuramoyl-tripeptide--D-alanyl-D-alanine ligase
MTSITLLDIARVTNGTLVGGNITVSTVSTDSRSIQKGDFFVALQGPNFDGHEYADEVVNQGACGLLVNRSLETSVPYVVVEDTLQALGLMGQFNGQKISVPTAAITGSNGKTTVEEMLASILAEQGAVMKTQGNFNNHIGLPLTLLQIKQSDDFAVIEMGANHPGEIEYLTNLTRPDVAVITNAGDAHLGGFGSREGVAKAKGEIYGGLSSDGIAVINADDKYFSYWKGLNENRNIKTFGFNENADVSTCQDEIAVSFAGEKFKTEFVLQYHSLSESVCLALAGRHNVSNALAAAAVALSLGVDLKKVAAGLAKVQPVNGRLKPGSGLNGVRVIDDTYNASPSSLAAAIEVLIDCEGERWLVMGDMGELGDDSLALHYSVGELAKEKAVDKLFAVGPQMQQAVKAFGHGAKHFANQADMVDYLCQNVHSGIVMLVKGSRAQYMENIVNGLDVGIQQNKEVNAC